LTCELEENERRSRGERVREEKKRKGVSLAASGSLAHSLHSLSSLSRFSVSSSSLSRVDSRALIYLSLSLSLS